MTLRIRLWITAVLTVAATALMAGPTTDGEIAGERSSPPALRRGWRRVIGRHPRDPDRSWSTTPV